MLYSKSWAESEPSDSLGMHSQFKTSSLRFARLKKYKPFVKPKKIKAVALPAVQAAEALVRTDHISVQIGVDA